MLRRGLIKPSPGDLTANDRGVSSTGDLCEEVVVNGNPMGAGLEGESVPNLDLLVPDRGVTL